MRTRLVALWQVIRGRPLIYRADLVSGKDGLSWTQDHLLIVESAFRFEPWPEVAVPAQECPITVTVSRDLDGWRQEVRCELCGPHDGHRFAWLEPPIETAPQQALTP
ncbi:MAG: hypothetical protein Q7J56_02980 [Deltaproteobacteria bacterium]|nr:hypothetical protein [Deltaproteobacteria bacterium]